MEETVRKVALVTGASRGIGRAIALKLAARGLDVAINFRANEEAAKQVLMDVEALGTRGTLLKGDVSSPEDAAKLIGDTISSLGRIDVLVNNAGITRDTLLMRMSDEDWDIVLQTNLSSAFYCTKAAIRPMMKQRSGRIINITSVAGRAGNAGQANYSAAKAGLIGLTMATAREVASRGVTVNAVAPGLIETDMSAALSEDIRCKIIEQIPLGRLGTVAEIASVVAFLASDEASYVTGQVLGVDGGMVMG